jgi:D-tagatose-1,6-bisphosphate aldolase subunit GatZ/KbaZ
MITVAKKHNLISKEHNGDYIPVSIIKEKFDLGLDSINIAPEFGLIETQTYINEIGNSDLFRSILANML